MEYDDDERLGGGIITLSVLHFIMSFFSIVGAIAILTASGNSEFAKEFEALNLNSGNMIFECIILRILLVVSLILILRKNKIGIYGYFLFAIISLIYNIATSGFTIVSTIIALIFPVLMAIFLSKKKSLFGFN